MMKSQRSDIEKSKIMGIDKIFKENEGINTNLYYMYTYEI